MNISPIVEKTSVLKTANNIDIQVADLPRNIRYEVETLDRLNQQRMDSICQVELIELAIRSQKIKIGELIQSASSPQKVDSPTGEST